ncbi:hypothetical protein TNCV_87041 [Trichonephila clavipes]|nr:hypothetical protein TNCV_87041 [Trichonephila clavipes]
MPACAPANRTIYGRRSSKDFSIADVETAKPTEEAEFEEDLYKCETRLTIWRETAFGWIAGGDDSREPILITSHVTFFKDNDSVDDTLKLF